MVQDFCSLLRRALQEHTTAIAGALVAGVSSWEDYQKAVGRCQGLQLAIEELNELEERARRHAEE